LLSAVLVLVEVLSTGVPGSIVDKALGFGERLAPMAVASAALSMVAMEVVGLVGIIGSYLERRLDEHFEKRAERARARQERARAREERARAEAVAEAVAEARAEARAQGRAEERAKWEERERRIAEDGARIPPPPPADEDNGA
jgi:ATPase subunit of ABC transporter with duplicated ATPase domains